MLMRDQNTNFRNSAARLWQGSAAHRLSCYLIAVLSVAVATLAVELVTRLLHAEAITSLMLCAVISTAWFGGFGAALLAIGLALGSFHYYLAVPTDSFPWKQDLLAVGIAELPRLFLFSVVSLFVAFVISAQRAATEALRHSSEELQAAIERQKRIEAALLHSEIYLTEAQRLSGTGSFGWKVRSGELFWSEETFRIFQYDRAARPTLEFIVRRVHPDDRAAVQKTIDDASRDGKDFDHKYRLSMPDGSVKHVHAVAHATRDAFGSIEFLGAITDVTAARETEQKLRRSEAYLAEAQRLSHTSSWAWDVRLQEFVYLSPEVYHLFGFDPEGDLLSPQSFQDRIVPEDRDLIVEMARNAVREKRDFEVEFRVDVPDGRTRYVNSVGHPLVGADGGVTELVGTHIDVTEQRLAREALQEAFDEIKKSEDRLRLVIDTIPTLVWRASPEGIPDFLNQPALDYTGLSLDQAETGWPRAFHPDDKKGMLVKWSAIRASGVRGGLEARLRRFDGEYRWFLFEAEPLRDGVGNIVKWYGAATDIQNRRQTEEELRRSEAKLAEAQRVSRTGSFVWNVSTGEQFGSREFFKILGYDQPRSVTPEMILKRAHPEDRARVERTMERSARDGKDIDYEHRLLMPDGSVKYVHVVAHAVSDQADQLEFIGAVVDVTAAKRPRKRCTRRRRNSRMSRA